MSSTGTLWRMHKIKIRKKKNKTLESFTKYLRQNLVFMWKSALREKFNFYFQETFTSADTIFISRGELSTRQ